MTIGRRRFLSVGAGLAVSTTITAPFLVPKHYVSYRRALSRVAVLEAKEYSDDLEQLLFDGLTLFRLQIRGKSVLLKPNLVENLPGPVNTNAVLVGGAARAFLRLGAAQVTIGEGSGHQRDTELIVNSAGLEEQIRERRTGFVDLNRDEVVNVMLKANYSGLGSLWLPCTVLKSDFIVSMPKIKTHHWAGVTLSLKNMFGVAPGVKYGWPKNLLHWHGIPESILDICATVPVNFVIADGIIAMEGNGPLHGTPRKVNRVVLSDDPVAADAICSRLMGIDPTRVDYLNQASSFLGNIDQQKISVLNGNVGAEPTPFSVLPAFRGILL
jgi:uncharacterized protein (DUF362 family)